MLCMAFFYVLLTDIPTLFLSRYAGSRRSGKNVIMLVSVLIQVYSYECINMLSIDYYVI